MHSTDPTLASNSSGILSRYRPALDLLFVALVGALLYGHTLGVPWYLDDRSVIVNSIARQGLDQAVVRLFTLRGFSRLTFALNHDLGGLNPLGYHLVNIAIHLAAACVVLLLLRRVFPQQRWAPLCGALLFVAHPLQTQAVTYVVQRMASLSALCFLCSLYLFVRSRELHAGGLPLRSKRHLACYLGALVAGLFALLAKETAIVLPLALLLFARYFPGTAEIRWRPLLSSVAPFCVAPFLFGLVYFVSPLLHSATALDTLSSSGLLGNQEGSTPLRYLVTEFSVLWIYIRLLFLPWGQALDYGYPVVTKLLTLQNLVAGLGLVGLLLLALRLRRGQPALSAGILWFFLTLAVESSLIPLDPLFEHRLYLPMFGFAMLLPALAGLIPGATLRAALLAAVFLVLAVLTWQRNDLWNDPIALYADNLRRTPQNERVCNDLAVKYMAAGRDEEARELLERALRINPRFLYIYLNLPIVYLNLGRSDDALRLLEAGIGYYPEQSSLYSNLALLYFRRGDYLAARTVLLRGLKFAPNDGRLQVNLGKVELQRGEAVAAERALRQGIALLGHAEAEPHELLAQALQAQGRRSEALRERAAAVTSGSMKK